MCRSVVSGQKKKEKEKMKTKINSEKELLESLWEQFKYCYFVKDNNVKTISENVFDDGSGFMMHGMLFPFDEVNTFLNTLDVLAEVFMNGDIDSDQYETFIQAEINVLTKQKEGAKK